MTSEIVGREEVLAAVAAFGGHWGGFVWNPTLREKPCSCWVKVGGGAKSLGLTATNFLKHWVIVYVHDGRVSEILMSERYVDS